MAASKAFTASMADETAAGTNPVASVKERSDADFISVPFLNMAGIGHTDDERLLYCRTGVVELLEFVDRVADGNVLGLIYGLPGTGKSSTLWYKMLGLSKQGKQIAWFHFDRNGLNEARVFLDRTGCREDPIIKKRELDSTIDAIHADILVLDGVTRDSYNERLEQLVFWRKAGPNRSAFLTVSNKIERLHPHELENMKEKGLYNYFTQHSWTLDEFLAAFVNEDESASPLFVENEDIFKSEWEISNDSKEARKRNRSGSGKFTTIREIITQKYFFVGGSARWMVRFTKAETEIAIRHSINDASRVGDILDFNLGPKSPAAKTHLYSSMEANGITVYAIVSERATQLLVETYGVNGIKTLYGHARKLNNPAFLGWVIEADYFSRCETSTLLLRKRGHSTARRIDFEKPVLEFDCGELFNMHESEGHEQFRAVRNLLPCEKNSPTLCKPKDWNQGGYDVVRIVKGDEVKEEGTTGVKESYHLLFGQVTKSNTHSLKLWYFSDLARCIVAAGFIVASVEIGFIVPPGKTKDFRITPSKVTGTGLLSHFDVHDVSPSIKWQKSHEHKYITVYELDMTGMNFPGSI